MTETVSAIRAVNDIFEQHLREGDAAALVRDYYVAEPFVVPPDLPLVRDAKAIEAFFVNRRAKLTPYRRPIWTPPFGGAAVIPVVDRRGPRTTTRTVRCAGGGVRGRSLLTHRVNRRGWGSGGRGFGLSSGF